ncbi:MAG: LytR/AlgR family response regulator transcription factor [Mangrovibacterium sp.]
MDKDRLKVLIVDDEKDARHLIRHYLKDIPQIALIEEAANVEDALFKVIHFTPDLIFLDILMPGRDGTELMELLKKRELHCYVVVVSGTEDSAILAIKNNVYEFLLKPVKKEDIEKSIDNFLKKSNVSLKEKLLWILKEMDDGLKISISSSNSYILVDPVDIVYCEAYGPYTTLHLENGTTEIANNYLGMLEKNLSDKRFYRISRSYLINLNKLLKINIGDYTCTLVCSKKKIKIKGTKKQLKILSEMDFE